MAVLEILPAEIITEIFSYLDYITLKRSVCLVNKFFEEIILEPEGEALRSALYCRIERLDLEDPSLDAAALGWHTGRPETTTAAEVEDEEFYCFRIHPMIQKMMVDVKFLEEHGGWWPGFYRESPAQKGGLCYDQPASNWVSDLHDSNIGFENAFSLPMLAKEWFQRGFGHTELPFVMCKGRLDGAWLVIDFVVHYLAKHVRGIPRVELHEAKGLEDANGHARMVDFLAFLCKEWMVREEDPEHAYAFFRTDLFDVKRTNTKEGGWKWSTLPDPHYRDPMIVCRCTDVKDMSHTEDSDGEESDESGFPTDDNGDDDGGGEEDSEDAGEKEGQEEESDEHAETDEGAVEGDEDDASDGNDYNINTRGPRSDANVLLYILI